MKLSPRVTDREPTRVYWGCTTGQCDLAWGDGKTPALDLPRSWNYCPECGGELVEISEYARPA